MDEQRRQLYDRYIAYSPTLQRASGIDIQYLDIKPAPIKVQVPLVDYFERMKRHRADAWQRDLCDQLQDAAAQRHVERWLGIIHAEGQLGKTSIISQTFPAWCIGHDPLFRYALAMYNQRRSEMHSGVVIQMMHSAVHKDMFPDKDGWIAGDVELLSKKPGVTSKTGWFTNARREINDGQFSFNPVGLQSGLTGSGFDWLSIDDPYKEAKEAFSEQINAGMHNFYDYTVVSRMGLHSCISGMFHRYAPEDFAGYLLDTGDFTYLRYASEADGEYIHESTGRRYPDPLNREEGELISPDRRPAKYYDKARKKNRVWLSMFQGRPSSQEGDFFNVGRIAKLSRELAAERIKECVAVVRAYDEAATDDAGAYTVGAYMGIRANGKVTVFDLYREQVDTAGRLQAMASNGRQDGTYVPLTIPLDPGSAGKSNVWFTKRELKDLIVVDMPTSGSKEQRAIPFSHAVNAHDVEFVDTTGAVDAEGNSIDWNKDAKKELRDFPLSQYKDIVDAMSQGYTYLYETMVKGKIVTGFKPQRNLLTYNNFIRMFPQHNATGKLVLKVPEAWTVYVGVKTSADASLPNCGIIVARASVNTDLEETLFILGEYKEYDANYRKLFDWIEAQLSVFCKKRDTTNTTIWLHPDSAHFAPAIRQKLNVGVAEFKGDQWAGYAELNWYFIPTNDAHPANAAERAARMYGLVKPGMQTVAMDKDGKPSSLGLYHLRQEIQNCGFNEKGEPSAVCQLLDTLRMCVAGFSTHATELTLQEEFERQVGEAGLVKEGEVLDVARQQQVMDARARARRRIRRRQGEDAAIDEDERQLITSWEQLGVSGQAEWDSLDPAEQRVREVEAIENLEEE